MAIALLSGDLTVISRVEGAARARGAAVNSASSTERLLTMLGEQAADAVIVDLSATAVELPTLIQVLKKRNAATRIVAFGPHVHEQRLAAARQAGCDEVLSRGQFFSQLDAVMTRAGI